MCVFITYLIHHFDHFLQLIRADVRTVSKPKVDEDPPAEEVLTLGWLLVVVDEREGSTQRRSSYRLGPLIFNHCKRFHSCESLLITIFIS